MFFIDAKVAIDTTGDANLTQIAGYTVEKSEKQQPATLNNHITGYDVNDVSEDEIREKFNAESFPEHITAEKIIHFVKIHKIDIHIPCVDADTSMGKTHLDKTALSQLLEIYKFLKGIRGLEKAEVDFVAGETGVRETNRIVGETTITAEDYINGVFYPDSVCYAFYPIDRHIMNGIEQKYHRENVVAKIPYAALIPKNSERILCAGRCIASDTYANSAIRVEAPCMATGQAAGCAAAIAAKSGKNVKNISYSEICKALKAINAIVPCSN